MGAAHHIHSIAILIVAGGRGARAGDGQPKQYRPLAGMTLLARTLHGLHMAMPQAALKVVIHKDDLEHYAASLAELCPSDRARLAPPAFGGATRQESVRNGLEALAAALAPRAHGATATKARELRAAMRHSMPARSVRWVCGWTPSRRTRAPSPWPWSSVSCSTRSAGCW